MFSAERIDRLSATHLVSSALSVALPLEIIIRPVSYTHLDVYKRQVQLREQRRERAA